MRAAHVSTSQKPSLAKAEPKGQARRKKGTIDTVLLFSQSRSPAPNVFSRKERRRGGGWGTEQTNRYKEALCQSRRSLWLLIKNAKIICNLSCSQRTRSTPLARPTVLAAGVSDTFWFDVRVFGVSAVWKRLAELHRPTKSLSASPYCRRGFIALSLCLYISSFPRLPLLYFCYVSTLSWVTRYTIRNNSTYKNSML